MNKKIIFWIVLTVIGLALGIWLIKAAMFKILVSVGTFAVGAYIGFFVARALRRRSSQKSEV